MAKNVTLDYDEKFDILESILPPTLNMAENISKIGVLKKELTIPS